MTVSHGLTWSDYEKMRFEKVLIVDRYKDFIQQYQREPFTFEPDLYNTAQGLIKSTFPVRKPEMTKDTTWDEIGADGVSRTEALTSRVLGSVTMIDHAYKSRQISMAGAKLAIDALVDATMPFVTRETRELLEQVQDEWKRRLQEANDIDAALANESMDDFGALA